MNRTSVLAQLTAEVMAEKKTAAPRKLTPVEAERPAPPQPKEGLPADLPGAFMSSEAMIEAARDLRRYAADMLRIADGIDVINGVPDKVEAQSKADRERDEALAQRERERVADERAAAKQPPLEPTCSGINLPDYPALQAEAQAAVFGSINSDGSPAWACPDHGKAVPKTSSKGREFIGCPDCTKFAR